MCRVTVSKRGSFQRPSPPQAPSTINYHHRDFRKFLTKLSMIKAEVLRKPIATQKDPQLDGQRA